MDVLNVLQAISILASFFLLAYSITFFSRVRLALRKGLFSCSKCGNCCRLRFVALTEEDIRRIESKGYQKFHEKFKDEFVMKRNNGKCVFLDGSGSCSIYEIRPEVCRNFPFFREFGILYCRDVSFCPGVERLKNAD
ncbi:MAG: YkgJ family cysteine cluster protein [Candidatus Altiarchaeota archaeon]